MNNKLMLTDAFLADFRARHAHCKLMAQHLPDHEDLTRILKLADDAARSGDQGQTVMAYDAMVAWQ